MRHSQSGSPFFSPVVIVPTYNNSSTLLDILARITRLGLPVIVINDGSTDDTAQLLMKWQECADASSVSRTVVTQTINLGKAAALQTGFLSASAAGYTHAATIDSDGQLDPEQLPQLLTAAQEQPGAFVIGVRDASRPDYPLKSRWGRELSNLFIQWECGLHVDDSQCGFRVYPLSMVKRVKCRAQRYGYETEIITRAVWSGWHIREVPVSCRYFPRENRVTHFRPLVDSIQSIIMHLRLLLISITHIGGRAAASDEKV